MPLPAARRCDQSGGMGLFERFAGDDWQPQIVSASVGDPNMRRSPVTSTAKRPRAEDRRRYQRVAPAHGLSSRYLVPDLFHLSLIIRVVHGR